MNFDVVRHNLAMENSLDDLDDASTIVNVSLLKNEKHIAKKPKLEVESVANLSELSEETAYHQPIDPSVKVVGWLAKESSQADSYEDSGKLEKVLECFVTNDWTNGKKSYYSDLNRKFRVNLFLLEVDPSPENEPLDLVSGYCYSGCKGYTVYSAVIWCQHQGFKVPTCPECLKTGIEKELRLLFKFKLVVMGQDGVHSEIIAFKENAERFLGCSTKDFILKPSVRKSAVYPLTELTVEKTLRSAYTPLLDIVVVCVEGLFFIADTNLKQGNDIGILCASLTGS